MPLTENGKLQYEDPANPGKYITITQTENNELDLSQIDLNTLRFKPDSNENGTGYATFQYRVYGLYNGVTTYSDTKTITINVTPINDAPVNDVPPDTQVVELASTTTLKLSNIKVNDPDLSGGTSKLIIPRVKYLLCFQ